MLWIQCSGGYVRTTGAPAPQIYRSILEAQDRKPYAAIKDQRQTHIPAVYTLIRGTPKYAREWNKREINDTRSIIFIVFVPLPLWRYLYDHRRLPLKIHRRKNTHALASARLVPLTYAYEDACEKACRSPFRQKSHTHAWYIDEVLVRVCTLSLVSMNSTIQIELLKNRKTRSGTILTPRIP